MATCQQFFYARITKTFLGKLTGHKGSLSNTKFQVSPKCLHLDLQDSFFLNNEKKEKGKKKKQHFAEWWCKQSFEP